VPPRSRYGLAVGGASGVDSAIEYFRRETVDTMLHSGVTRIDELGSRHVRNAVVAGVHGPLKVGVERLA
jgi:isopentenyl diphosphate isomerase/L-lactate dehydrogenase-like FMN-dependent dehydrogenase